MNKSSALRPPKPHQNYQPTPPTDEGFGRYIGMSVGFHVLLLAIFTIRGVFFAGEPIQLERAIRVDMVGLPDKKRELPKGPPVQAAKPQVKAPEAPKPAEPVKPAEKPAPKPPIAKKELPPPKPAAPKADPSKVNLNKTKQAQESALKRLEALNRVENMVSESKAEKAAKAAAAASAPVRGNEISKGSDLSGISKLENDDYLTTLDQHVKRNWDVPNFLARAKLSASAVVYLDENGNVIKKVLVRSSGNEIFDETVMNSISKASPFPVPPKRLVNLFMNDGIQLGFPD